MTDLYINVKHLQFHAFFDLELLCLSPYVCEDVGAFLLLRFGQLLVERSIILLQILDQALLVDYHSFNQSHPPTPLIGSI